MLFSLKQFWVSLVVDLLVLHIGARRKNFLDGVLPVTRCSGTRAEMQRVAESENALINDTNGRCM